MKARCQACGAEKDTDIKEVYPYPDDGVVDDQPIEPLTTIDCQGPRVGEVTDWRVVTVCHECFHKLDADMWISDEGWQFLNPVTAFDQLPKLYAEPKA